MLEPSTTSSGFLATRSSSSSKAWKRRIFARAYSSVPVKVRPRRRAQSSRVLRPTKIFSGNMVLRSAET